MSTALNESDHKEIITLVSVLNKIEKSLEEVNGDKARLEMQASEIRKELLNLCDLRQKMEEEIDVLKRILSDRYAKNIDLDTTGIINDRASITPPLYGGESVSTGTMLSSDTEIHLVKIAKGAAEQIKKQIERNNKYGKV